MKQLDYSVVVPVFNSEGTLKELFRRTKAVFDELQKSFEIIFVEDGGSDNSWNVLTELKKDFSDYLTAIKLSKNFGQHNAILCGIKFSKGKFIITIDDDLQIPPEEIKKLIKCFDEKQPDLVYGSYKRKKHSFFRNLGSLFVKRSAKRLFNAPGEGSSFKLFTNDLAQNILAHLQEFVFIDELLLWYTGDIAFVEVEHLKRRHNKSGYTPLRLITLFFNIVIYYTAVPLKVMTYIGLISSLVSFAFGIRFIIRKVFYHVPLGYTSIIVTVLFSASIILFSLGIIGEYLSRIYKVQNKKPPYSIKKVL